MSWEQSIYNVAKSDGMPSNVAAFIAAQSKHETGNYTSHFFTQDKNAFGYSYSKGSKWQLSSGGGVADNGLKIARYDTVTNSVHELTDWIKRRQKEGKFPQNLSSINSATQYATLLKNAGYYGAPLSLYAAALEKYLRTLPEAIKKGLSSPMASMLIIATGALLVYYLTR